MHAAAPGLRTPAAIRSLLRATTVLIATAALLAGCAGTGGPNPFTGGGSNQLLVTVDNNNMQDVTVYLMAPSLRQRLGRVGSHQTRTFTMSWTHTREIRLELDFLAGPRCYSFPVTASPGDELEMIVQPSLTRMDCR